MKRLLLIFAALQVLSAQTARKSHIDDLIAGAKAKTEKSPDRVESYVDLANALARRARERSDPAFDRQAEDAIAKALALHPADFEARKVRVIVRLHQGRFADALEEAQVLNKEIPDDNLMYGLITDAQMGLGNYKEAEASAQRMIDMRQVNAPGLERGAKLREVLGYPDGAIDWWGSALRLTSATDEEERAYVLVQVARLHRNSGKAEMASRHAEQALGLEPDYPAALTELALDRMAQGKPEDAVPLLRKRLAASPDIDSFYWLAEALARTHAPEATAAAADFEQKALSEAKRDHQASPLLIRYEAEHGKAEDAVRLAKDTASRRHDIHTLDSYAWALYMAGEYSQANAQMSLALAPGIRDATIFYHAGMIAQKTNDLAAARKFWKQSLELDSSSVYAPRLMQSLSSSEAH